MCSMLDATYRVTISLMNDAHNTMTHTLLRAASVTAPLLLSRSLSFSLSLFFAFT